MFGLVRLMVVSVALLASADLGHAKVFGRCELVRTLRANGIPSSQLADWMCLAYHESRYNSGAVGPPNRNRSIDHGIFQLNDKYWCRRDNRRQYRNACGRNCNAFQDDNISDDIDCARRVYREHQRLQGNGFLAWYAWRSHCQGRNLQSYVQGC